MSNSFTIQVAIIRYAEAMRLVADGLKYQAPIHWQSAKPQSFLTIFSIDLFFPFCQRDERK